MESSLLSHSIFSEEYLELTLCMLFFRDRWLLDPECLSPCSTAKKKTKRVPGKESPKRLYTADCLQLERSEIMIKHL